jgi:hypothetical protein
VPPSGELTSEPIPLTDVTEIEGPLIVKAIGADADGRRVVAWADLSPDRQTH